MNTPSQTPVLVGIGEVCDRPEHIEDVLEPVDLMAEALRLAQADAGADLLNEAQSIEVIGFISWLYANPVGLLCEKLGIAPARQINASMGGETPIRLIHEAALRILSGDTTTSLIVGGESFNAVSKALKNGTPLNWTPPVSKEEAVRFPNDYIELSPIARKLGIRDPAAMYPFYEVALQAERGIAPKEGTKASAELWARYAQVAESNPYAWIRSAPSADDIASADGNNRMINWPYPKLMVANPAVNQSAAMIVTSLERARELDVAEDKIVYLWGGGNASESEDFLHRDSYCHSRAQEVVLDKAVSVAGGDPAIFRHMELYSCFPVVPKMALSHLGLEDSPVLPTVAGGLTFFGGPLNNYMTHACCAMVRALRENRHDLGLLYGQGGFVNKHHSMVVSCTAPADGFDATFSLQDEAERRRDAVPEVAGDDFEGDATIETYTVLYDRSGMPTRGVIIFRSSESKRGMAQSTDPGTIAMLTSQDASAVGHSGYVTLDETGLPVWTAQ